MNMDFPLFREILKNNISLQDLYCPLYKNKAVRGYPITGNIYYNIGPEK